MIEKGAGSIVNFSSIHGITGGRNVPLYHATKGAVRLLSKSDAAAYGSHGIRVNSIHPGSMNTRMSRRSAEQSEIGPEEYYKQLVGSNPLPRQGEPDEIAYGVLYLASATKPACPVGAAGCRPPVAGSRPRARSGCAPPRCGSSGCPSSRGGSS